jgi:hypothetical protein
MKICNLSQNCRRIFFTAFVVIALAASAQAKPVFQMPFPSGEKYLYCSDPSFASHEGDKKLALDFIKPQGAGKTKGAYVLASAPGTVCRIRKHVGEAAAGDNADAGQNGVFVEIDHGGGWKTVYCHFIDGSIPGDVGYGSSVAAGQLLGRAGATGTVTDCHLHYAQTLNGKFQTQLAEFNGVIIPDDIPEDYSYDYEIVSNNKPLSSTTLVNGASISALAGTMESVKFYKIIVPSGATELRVTTTGGTGDCDVYVKAGAMPTTSLYDDRGYENGNDEDVHFTSPASGEWYIVIHGYKEYSGVTLSATYSGRNSPVAEVGDADIVFLLDSTGSMNGVISSVKTNIQSFVNGLDAGGIKWRAKVVGYRDIHADGNAWYEDAPFVTTASSISAQLAELSAGGGGDTPESMYDALYKVITESEWRERAKATPHIIVFTDAATKPLSLGAVSAASIAEIAGAKAVAVSTASADGTEVIIDKLNAGHVYLTAFVPPFNSYSSSLPCYDDLALAPTAKVVPVDDMDDFVYGETFANVMKNIADDIVENTITDETTNSSNTGGGGGGGAPTLPALVLLAALLALRLRRK